MDNPKPKDALKEIVKKKAERIAMAKQALPEEELKSQIAPLGPTRGFIAAINKPRDISLIAEIKKQSPSAGMIRDDFDPVVIAGLYQEAGAQALSVLTEEDFFGGSPEYLKQARDAVELPILRKDFIIEPYQVYESRLIGADAILLIVDLLSKEKLTEMMAIASALGLDCLLEVHNEKEIKKALDVKAKLIGINNRNLRTLEVDLNTTQLLYPRIPKEIPVVVESGLSKYQDILFLKVLGVKAVLIGQAFMQAGDIRTKVAEVMGW